MTVETHRCYRGPRCVDAEPSKGERHGREIAAEAGLCPSCDRVVDRAIRELPADYVQLHSIIGKVKGTGGEIVSGSRELPIPLDLGVEALASELVHAATSWAAAVSDVLGVNIGVRTIRSYRPAVALAYAVEHLVGNLSVLLALRDVPCADWVDGELTAVERHGYQGATDLLVLHERARATLGLTRLTHRLPVPCPRCERPALLRRDGDDTVHCATCAHRLPWDDYQDLCNVLTTGGARD